MSINKMRATFATTSAALTLAMVSTGLNAQESPQRNSSYSGTLAPLNDSGVSGSFTIQQRGQGQIIVMIEATGLEVTDQPHVAHIHGLSGNQEAMCPTIAQDQAGDNDGFIELGEGAANYGPIIIPLGDLDPDNDGIVSYSQTFNLNNSATFDGAMSKDDLFPIALREIVVHGLTLEEGEGANGGEADGYAGYKTVLPVACGAVQMDMRPGRS